MRTRRNRPEQDDHVMKSCAWRLSVGIAAACLAAGCSRGDTGETRESGAAPLLTIPDTVRQELVRLGKEDQAVREDLTPDVMQDTVFAKRMLHGDSARTTRLRALIDTYGWPDSARAGREAAQAAFLVLQHSPLHTFQKEMLPTIENLAKEGAVASDQAALLVDRVLLQEGRPQRYGTQFRLVDGRLVMDSVTDAAGLEERRKAMGLSSMDEYIRLLEEVYHAEVVRRPGSGPKSR